MLTSLMFADEFSVFVELNNFLENEKTVNEIVYKIPYEGLGYVSQNNQRISIVKVEYQIFKDKQLVTQDTLTHNIIQTRKSKRNFLVNKINPVISESGYQMKLKFIDELAKGEYAWETDLQVLPKKTLLSTLEFNSEIFESDDKENQFYRENQIFIPNPHHNYFLPEQSNLIVYYEIYNLKQEKDISEITESLSISLGDSLVFQKFRDVKLTGDKNSNYYEIDISNFVPGLYKVNLQVIDRLGRLTLSRDDVFVVRETKEEMLSIFGEVQKDYTLIKFFLSNSEKNVWKKLSLEGKVNFINHFWKTNDSNPATEENEFMDLIKERVEIANNRYGSINITGWKTDMGRIYIRNGDPDEVIKDETNSSYNKYSSKRYYIWKFYQGMKVYVFIDKYTNGNYKMIYKRNDELENTAYGWRDMLGEDFDESQLDF